MKERIAGLGFLVVLAALLSLCVAVYAKTFSPGVAVTLNAPSTGLQLSKGADVKLHGVLVGEVREVNSRGDGAELSLSLDPVSVPQIPADVSARLLPKTLFGEKYVELVAPESPSEKAIGNEAVIKIDASDQAVELEEVLDGALPLLRAVPPEKLAVTLTSLASALEGRGDELGETIVQLGDVVRALDEEMPAIENDITQLAEVLDNYRGALPDLVEILENLTVTNKTIYDQEESLKSLWINTQDFSDETRVFLDRYQGRLIQFAEVTQPFVDVLATYAPEYPCLFQGLTSIEQNIKDSFSGGRLHITLEITQNNGKYEQGVDEPAWGPYEGPDCRGLPSPDTPGPERQFPNGYDYDSSRANLPVEIPGLTDTLGYSTQDPDATSSGADGESEDGGVPLPFDPSMGYAGTSTEQDVMRPLVAAATGKDAEDVDDYVTLLWGPLLRGVTVSAK
ncbi:MAG: MCE family protein [Stackebrandtia sp.]